MFNKNDKLELHIGEDYAVAMLPRDATDDAAVNFGCSVKDEGHSWSSKNRCIFCGKKRS